MNRCAPSRRAALALSVAVSATLLAAALPATAQVARNFPQKALRGEIVFGAPPTITLNGSATQLAPGARVRDTNNMLVMSGALVGLKATVHYTLDHLGQPLDVWLLRSEEIARKPWPKTVDEAQAWTFDPVGQTWTQP